jgi:hypothetical protein
MDNDPSSHPDYEMSALHKHRRALLGFGVVLITTPSVLHAQDIDWNSILGSVGLKRPLDQKTADQGIRALLNQGMLTSITRLSKIDGYWKDAKVSIPLPKPLNQLQSTLKPLKASGALDELHLSLNRAAEKSAPLAKNLFMDAIKAMTITDAVGIVKGAPNSGTLYLQKATSPRLISAFSPIMMKSVEETGALALMRGAIKKHKLSSIIKDDPAQTLTQHGVKWALNGIFHYIGTEETLIRNDPSKRSSQILKTVFG